MKPDEQDGRPVAEAQQPPVPDEQPRVPSIHGIGKWIVLSLAMTLLVLLTVPTALFFAILAVFFATRAYRYDPSIGMALIAATLIASVYAFRIGTFIR
jgi:hypothetical protein